MNSHRLERCFDKELRSDLPNDLFLQLDLIRKQLVLGLDFQIFLKKQCFGIDKILIAKKFYFLILRVEKKNSIPHTLQFSKKQGDKISFNTHNVKI